MKTLIEKNMVKTTKKVGEYIKQVIIQDGWKFALIEDRAETPACAWRECDELWQAQHGAKQTLKNYMEHKKFCVSI